MLRLLLLVFVPLLLVACSGEDRSSASSSPDPTATPDRTVSLPVDVETEDLTKLVTWRYLFVPQVDLLTGLSSSQSHISPRRDDLTALLTAVAEAEDDRYKAVLYDLSFLPTPYADLDVELLLQREGPFTFDDVMALYAQRGFRQPEDDLPQFLLFKQALFATIHREFGAFLDPELPRTISAQEILWGGVSVDGIPPLNLPRFRTAAQVADWIFADDQVIGVEINGDARAYPRRIIDWHEMVNDTVGGVPVSLAYCTLCGSAILYDSRYGDEVYRFGTSGLLYRSNKLMYDKNTRSLWEQYTGEPAWGSLVGTGIRLKTLPVVHTTWEEWLAAHPDTKVLDINTGFERDYDPGVAYYDYWTSTQLRFPAPNQEGPLALKTWVYAVRLDNDLVAYPIALLAEKGLIHDSIGDQPILLVATGDGSGGRAYESGGLQFRPVDAPGELSSSDGRRWRLTEAALVADDGAQLLRLPGHNSFWFAVTNHAPTWRLYQED